MFGKTPSTKPLCCKLVVRRAQLSDTFCALSRFPSRWVARSDEEWLSREQEDRWWYMRDPVTMLTAPQVKESARACTGAIPPEGKGNSSSNV